MPDSSFKLLPTLFPRIGRRILSFDTLDSTNSRAAQLASDPGQHGLVILAGEQTAGRGQHGRTWTSPPGASLLMSILLYPALPLRRPVVLTAWAAVAACETILKTTGIQSRIKWPNDVLVRNRKICGILIEQRVREGSLASVAGIGLNVNQDQASFTAAGLTEATSLAILTGAPRDCLDLALEFIKQLDEEYGRLEESDFAGLEQRWIAWLGLLGEQATIKTAGDVYRGQIREISFDGVEIELPDKKILRLAPENIRHIHV